MLGDACGSVDGALDDAARVGVVDCLVPAGVGAGSGVEEGSGGVYERFGAGGVEAEIAREAEVSEGVPIVWASGRGGVGWILREEFFDGAFVGEDGGGVDVGGRDLRVTLEDELGLFEGPRAVRVVAWDAGSFDEGKDRIREVGEGAKEVLGFDVGGEFGPAIEAVFASEDVLRVGESEVCGGDFGQWEFVESGVTVLDAFEGFRLGGAMCAEEFLGLFFVLFEVRAGG